MENSHFPPKNWFVFIHTKEWERSAVIVAPLHFSLFLSFSLLALARSRCLVLSVALQCTGLYCCEGNIALIQYTLSIHMSQHRFLLDDRHNTPPQTMSESVPWYVFSACFSFVLSPCLSFSHSQIVFSLSQPLALPFLLFLSISISVFLNFPPIRQDSAFVT